MSLKFAKINRVQEFKTDTLISKQKTENSGKKDDIIDANIDELSLKIYMQLRKDLALEYARIGG